jgi:hypothetical protein
MGEFFREILIAGVSAPRSPVALVYHVVGIRVNTRVEVRVT